jgi:hypothetical protein
MRPTPTPVPTRPVAPTFTPTPDFIQALVVVTPPNQGTPGVIVVPPGVDPSSLIPIPETPTPTVTWTSTPSPTPTPTPTEDQSQPALPSATVQPGIILTPIGGLIPPTATPARGPGVEYPLVAQLGPNIPVSIIGQNPEGAWFQICCVNGGSVWVARSHVTAVNDTSSVALVLAETPPTATPTSTPSNTPTITPTPTATPFPFQVLEGPLYFPTNNEMLTIWVKVTANGGQTPLPGYFLKVQFRNRTEGSSFEDRPNTKGEQPSADFFEYNVPPGPGSGNRVQFNYKYEFLPPDPKAEDPNTTATRASLMDGYWRIYLTDGSGTQLSNAIEFNTLAGNINREVYVAWVSTQ